VGAAGQELEGQASHWLDAGKGAKRKKVARTRVFENKFQICRKTQSGKPDRDKVNPGPKDGMFPQMPVYTLENNWGMSWKKRVEFCVKKEKKIQGGAFGGRKMAKDHGKTRPNGVAGGKPADGNKQESCRSHKGRRNLQENKKSRGGRD